MSHTWQKIGSIHMLVVPDPYRKVEVTGPRPYNVSLYFWDSFGERYLLASSSNLASRASLEEAKVYGEKLLYPEPIDTKSSYYTDG